MSLYRESISTLSGLCYNTEEINVVTCDSLTIVDGIRVMKSL